MNFSSVISLVITSLTTKGTTTSAQPHFDKPWGNYLMEEIAETQMPEPISWLPQTIGWQILALILLFFIGYKGYQAYKSYQGNAYRRGALKWLAYCQQSNDINLYKQLPTLLRKTALSAFNRSDISQLSGSRWEHWLDQQCQQTSFVSSCPTLLHQLAFMPTNANTINTEKTKILIRQITIWVKHHRRQDD